MKPCEWRGKPLLGMLESGDWARIVYAKTWIRAVGLREQARERVPPPAELPWVLLEQVAYTADQRPALYSLGHHRGDLFEFHAIRHRTLPGGKPA